MASFHPYQPRSFNPINALHHHYDDSRAYPPLPSSSGDAIFKFPSRSPTSSPLRKYRHLRPTQRLLRPLLARIILLVLVVTAFVAIAGREGRSRTPKIDPEDEEPKMPYIWQAYPRYWGYFNGVKTLHKPGDHEPQNIINDPGEPLNLAEPRLRRSESSNTTLPLNLHAFDPYPKYNSQNYLKNHHLVHQCYIDKDEKIAAPDIYAYPGLPLGMPYPIFGSYQELDLRQDVCFERYGRLGPYGWGYPIDEGGLAYMDLSTVEHEGIEELWDLQPKINYSSVDWGTAQKHCSEKNQLRFSGNGSDLVEKEKVTRTAFVLRAYTGFTWSDFEIASIRAMITELSLKSGGEYDVHILLELKDDTVPAFASPDIYKQTVEQYVPKEFWGITTMWSHNLTRLYYPGPFEHTVENFAEQDIYGTYRSGHWALQWFSQMHPEYDFFWNWEMDVRSTGHYYDFFEKLGTWAKKQPRKGLWERSAKFWIPSVHGDYQNFTKMIEEEIAAGKKEPIWGPVKFDGSRIAKTPMDSYPNTTYDEDDYEWGVGEDADLIVFDPLFDPDETIWVFRRDITGYNPDAPIPPRRTSIVTTSRFSKRLLGLMHNETYQERHSAFPEMWPATCSLHHGLKAVYAPHPVYFDRQWPMDYMNQVFNYPKSKQQSPFGYGEHNLKGSTFYYDSWFAGGLWRRWLGDFDEDGEGGPFFEIQGSGRMCLRTTIFHPVKRE